MSSRKRPRGRPGQAGAGNAGPGGLASRRRNFGSGPGRRRGPRAAAPRSPRPSPGLARRRSPWKPGVDVAVNMNFPSSRRPRRRRRRLPAPRPGPAWAGRAPPRPPARASRSGARDLGAAPATLRKAARRTARPRLGRTSRSPSSARSLARPPASSARLRPGRFRKAQGAGAARALKSPGRPLRHNGFEQVRAPAGLAKPKQKPKGLDRGERRRGDPCPPPLCPSTLPTSALQTADFPGRQNRPVPVRAAEGTPPPRSPRGGRPAPGCGLPGLGRAERTRSLATAAPRPTLKNVTQMALAVVKRAFHPSSGHRGFTRSPTEGRRRAVTQHQPSSWKEIT